VSTNSSSGESLSVTIQIGDWFVVRAFLSTTVLYNCTDSKVCLHACNSSVKDIYTFFLQKHVCCIFKNKKHSSQAA